MTNSSQFTMDSPNFKTKSNVPGNPSTPGKLGLLVALHTTSVKQRQRFSNDNLCPWEMDLFAKLLFIQPFKTIWLVHETHNAIPFEVYHNKWISLVSQPAFPLLCTVVQGMTIVHKASSTHLALWIHSTALLFEKRHAERSFFFFFCCLSLKNSQCLKIIRALWSILWFWFPSSYERREINLNLPKLMYNF